ncbi:MAG: DUF4956 domain-containing protein [Oscillospiraceae bacterium]|nr:DUF4956 domain-containing protein [Oscillospiraceae bacterium]MBR6924153.1 DUF4956 domain-containing protein [Oscillospiraceae bacterium]
MTNFNDIIKNKFLESFTNVSIPTAIITMLIAFCLGLFIFFVYKKVYSGVMYSSSFGVTLISLTMITSLVILAVTSNVVLSLGMVGALSIVRFRTAIKDQLDIAFLFWSLVTGIVLAAGLYPLAVIGSIMIAAVLLIFVNRKPHYAPYILVVQCEDRTAEIGAEKFIKEQVDKQTVKSKSVRAGRVELNMEIRLKNDSTEFINRLSEMKGVTSAVMVSYNGDYMS